MATFNEREILRLKDRIYDLKQLMKSLELQEDEKAFKHRCIPIKRTEAKSNVYKSALPLILLTILGLWGIVTSIICLRNLVVFSKAGVTGMALAGHGLSLMGAWIFAAIGGIYGGMLWKYTLKQLVYIRALNALEKKLGREIETLNAQIKDLQKEIEVCATELAQMQDADYLRTVDLSEKIDMDNLRRYIAGKYVMHKEVEKRIAAPEVIPELMRFGYVTLGDIDKVIDDKPSDFFVPEEGTNGAGLLRNVMIITDSHRYFTESYKGGWVQTPIERVKFWQEKGVVNIEKYLKEYGIEVKL